MSTPEDGTAPVESAAVWKVAVWVFISTAPMMPALFFSFAGTIGVRRSSRGRNLSCFFDTPPPTTNRSGLKSISTWP